MAAALVDSLSSSLAGKALVVAAYLGLNLSLNLSNKWIISLYGFKFPLFLSMAHMAFSFVVLLPVMATKGFRELHRPTLEKQWLGVMSVGAFFAASIGFNNVSLLSISLSLNQVIRSCIPVVTAIAAVVVESKRPSRQEFLSLCVLVGGVCIAVWEGSGTKSSFLGTMLCIAGTISNGLMMSMSGRMMTEKVDVLRLTFYTAPVVVVSLLPFYMGMEAKQLVAYMAASTTSNGYIGLVLLTCANALAYNAIHLLVIKLTSSVTTTVLGEMKIILILVLSSILLKEADIWTMKMLFGCSMAIFGFCMYSHVKLKNNSSNVGQPVIKGVPDLPPLSERTPILTKGSQA